MKPLDLFLIDPEAVWAALLSNALIKGDYRISWKKKIQLDVIAMQRYSCAPQCQALILRMTHPL